MATKKSTPGTRSRRNTSPSPAAPAFIPEPLQDHIEAQRARLMDAEAALDCIAAALEDDERMNLPGPYYPRALRIARDIFRATIDQLDSVRVKSCVSGETYRAEGSSSRENDCVKETATPYLH